MVHRRRLLARMLRHAFADSAWLALLVCVVAVLSNGFAWSTLNEVAVFLLVCFLLSALRAAWRVRSLVRAARGLGIPVSESVLDRTQTYTLTGVPLSFVRAELGAAPRASEVGDGNPLGFHWRPFRGRATADGTVAFDESSGEARIEVRAGKGLTTDAPLNHGAVFLALCQIVRTLEHR
ncbi:hypothetical protein AB0D74_09825 [Streptomyces sp. NPDC048278]|uniref:hypothetical protein n=1 Tax=Streptomyces sp. NPDC048278 TaxID=3155809 RepID=UPI0034458831